MDTYNICTAWRQQTALVDGFADELNVELMNLYPSHFKQIDKDFSDLCGKTGENGLSKQLNLKKFIELMSVSGLLHGCTLSLTRLHMTPPLIALMDTTSSRYTFADANLVTLMLGTITGSMEGHSVFSYRIPLQRVQYGIIKVLQKYSGFSDAIKAAYLEEIKQLGTQGTKGTVTKGTIFRDFGWILTDHGPEGIDGKQYTLASYI